MKKSKNKLINSIFLALSILLFNCKKEQNTEAPLKAKKTLEHLPYYKDAEFTPNWISPNSADLKDFHAIRPFKLVNQLGDSISNETFNGKIYITDFFFTTCSGICPKMTSNMKHLQEHFKKDDQVLLLSHSVTPNFDTVEILNKYAESKNIDANKWHLVTGDRSDIYDLGRNFYYVEEGLGLEKAKDDFLHTENFVLIDANKHIRGIYNGLKKSSIKQLISDIEILKKE